MHLCLFSEEAYPSKRFLQVTHWLGRKAITTRKPTYRFTGKPSSPQSNSTSCRGVTSLPIHLSLSVLAPGSSNCFPPAAPGSRPTSTTFQWVVRKGPRRTRHVSRASSNERALGAACAGHGWTNVWHGGLRWMRIQLGHFQILGSRVQMTKCGMDDNQPGGADFILVKSRKFWESHPGSSRI